MHESDLSNLPSLTAWLKGADANHPLLVAQIHESLLEPLETIVRELEQAHPLRIAQKCRAFRTLRSFDALIERRAELLAGSLLAAAGVPFEFGADYPDLVLANAGAGIEVGTRRLDGQRRLHEQVVEALSTLSAPGCEIVLTFDERLLKISEERIAGVVTQIVGAALGGNGRLRFEDLGLTVAVEPDLGWSAPHVTTFHQKLGSNLSDHVEDVVREIENKIDEKRRQTSKMPTALLLDLSRVGDAWMVSNEIWAQKLHVLLEHESAEDVSSEHEGYVGFAFMFTSLDSWLPAKLAAVVSDDAPMRLHMVFDQLAKLIEPPTDPRRAASGPRS